MNILVVEDDLTDMKLFSTVLRGSGHRVDGRLRADEAFVAIKAQRPEVILLDLKLPDLDGLELARRLKQEPATRHIPIVAVTAAAETFTREQALAAGCDAYIVKPVDTRQLSDQITAAAGKSAG